MIYLQWKSYAKNCQVKGKDRSRKAPNCFICITNFKHTILMSNHENVNEQAVDQLNHLIETCYDGENGYKKAAEDVDNTNLKTLFNNYAEQRYRFGHELKEHVRQLGGDPEKGTTVKSDLHRVWIDIKSAFTSGGEKAVLAECERGDNYAVDAYAKAVETDLPLGAKQLVQRQHGEIVEARNKIESLKNAYEVAA